MRPYLKEPDPAQNYIYNLYAVLVHNGEMAGGGHYYVFIRPDQTREQWLIFNDDVVQIASMKQVYDLNFGGEIDYLKFNKEKASVEREKSYCTSTAYMLVYIR